MHFLNPKRLENGKVTNLYFLKFQFMEYICFIFNLFGIGLAALQYDLEFEEYISEQIQISQWILWMIMGSTALLVLFTFSRYQARIEWMKSRGIIGSRDKFLEIDDNFYMMVEIIIYCIIPLPFTSNIRITFYNVSQEAEAFYHVNEILTLLMTFRGIYLYRTILTLTFWSSNRTLRVCEMFSCEHDFLFVIKSLLRTSPYLTQFVTLFSLLFIFGHQLRICERPLSRNNEILDNLGVYYNSVWCIIITITFVGYGDYYPRTDLGRMIVIIVCLVGIFILAVMIVTFIESLKTSPLENQTVSLLEKLRHRDQLQQQAASVITLSMQSILGWRNGTMSPTQQHHIELRLKSEMQKFKMNLHQLSRYDVSNENLINHVGYLRNELNELRNDYKNDMRQLKSKLDTQNENYANLMNQLSNILNK